MVKPGYFCSNLLQKCFIGVNTSKCLHVPKISWRKAFHLRKGRLEIKGKPANHVCSPPLFLLPGQDFFPDMPVKIDEFLVHRKHRLQLCLLYPCLYSVKKCLII